MNLDLVRAIGLGMSAISLGLVAWIFRRQALAAGRSGWSWVLYAALAYFLCGIPVGFVQALLVSLMNIRPSTANFVLLGLGSQAATVGLAYFVALRAMPTDAVELPLTGDWPGSPSESPHPVRTPEKDDTCGFFVFDYNAMGPSYGEQAFGSIYDSLRSSSGVCVFHDGDIFNSETVRSLASKRTSSSQSVPIARLPI